MNNKMEIKLELTEAEADALQTALVWAADRKQELQPLFESLDSKVTEALKGKKPKIAQSDDGRDIDADAEWARGRELGFVTDEDVGI